MREVRFAYAQTRIQAQLARRPTPVSWQLIETGQGFAQALDGANRTALAPYIVSLGRDSLPAAIQPALDDAWNRATRDLAKWLAPSWRPALQALNLLPHLRRANAEGQSEAAIGAGWLSGFKASLPERRGEVMTALAPLLERFLLAAPPTRDDTPALMNRLERLVRLRPQTPEAVLAYGGIVALDIERLSGALLTAALLPDNLREEAT